MINIIRLASNPIISPEMDKTIGSNINGPSLIRVPDWIEKPLGRYYLYFAHHQGNSIRLAFANNIAGPWKIHPDASLRLNQTPCSNHIASPDVHVDHIQKRIIMYYHGVALSRFAGWKNPLTKRFPMLGRQRSLVATSSDGIDFRSHSEILGSSYFRIFYWANYYYALGMPGIFYRSRNGITNFEQGPTLFDENMRHSAVTIISNELYVFYSITGSTPEHIVLSRIDLTKDWMDWKETAPVSVLMPETEYEGSNLPLRKSVRGAVHKKVRELRDPCIFQDKNHLYLLYTIAGESGIAIAELIL